MTFCCLVFCLGEFSILFNVGLFHMVRVATSTNNTSTEKELICRVSLSRAKGGFEPVVLSLRVKNNNWSLMNGDYTNGVRGSVRISILY